ncbi:3-alpha--hydroxysteroid dehydrogenase [Setomelanomma holmii]|uniref:3-alpha--hydroxysteroid dehydrogenase n=1 Tax=Setomelanomma holmii TaxID=210430 RepID=A0A9P4HBD4_9PLEO|nr:3-alpha--hydroxysteroid dehydrogenase [Setomelanomma holmii]
MSLKDRVIVITGAASGMGLETARLFAKKGAKISLADVQEKPLKDLEAELQQSGAQVIAQVVDVRDRKAVEAWVTATVEKFGKLDGAANLAGVIGKQANIAGIDALEDDDWDFVMGVNVVGLKNCLRAQVPHFNEGAAIVNAASILGLIGAAKNLAYCALKHAVDGMTRAAAKELGPKKIRVNCICPGPIDTPMLRKSIEIKGSEIDWSFLALGRAAHQAEVPPLIEFLTSDASSFITTDAMQIDGGWYC